MTEMPNQDETRERLWSSKAASQHLDKILDGAAAGCPQTIERAGVRFVVQVEQVNVANSTEHLLAGGPLDSLDDLGN